MTIVVPRLRLLLPALVLGGVALAFVESHGAPRAPDAQDGKDAKVKDGKDAPERGSIVEDRAARKLLEAGDARLEAGEAGEGR